MERADLVGCVFDGLTVLAAADPTPAGNRRWLCRCECGKTATVLETNLKRHHTKSCGCRKSPDLTGRVFGKLTVLGRSERRSHRGSRTTPTWKCRCECGEITYKATDSLTNPDISMCAHCAKEYGASKARAGAGFVEGTQISRLLHTQPTAASTSGCRGVYFDKKTNKWRARLKFKGKLMNFGSYTRFEDAVAARKEAEETYFGEFLAAQGIVDPH